MSRETLQQVGSYRFVAPDIAEHALRMMDRPMVESCALCPERFEGSAGECIEWGKSHRALHGVADRGRAARAAAARDAGRRDWA